MPPRVRQVDLAEMILPATFARYAAMRVPRYTSYPTAPHFSPAITETEYRQMLRTLPSDRPASIYLHIPFCRQMCWYCGCHTSVTRRNAPISRYVSVLCKEIDAVGAELRAPLTVDEVHFGGGSPTLLSPEDIGAIARRLGGSFILGPSTDIAVEIDPRNFTPAVAQALAQAGVNRASLGVQTFDPKVQAAINRRQSFAVVAEAVRLLKRSGIEQVNFDLLYGLPHQTTASCIETVRAAVRLKPARLAVFGYAHVPSFKPHQRKIDECALPGVEQREEQFSAIADALTREGYEQVGLDHFAVPSDPLAKAAAAGTMRRNFQGYTTDSCSTLLAFGASAIGRLANAFVQNAVRIPDYERRILKPGLAAVRGVQLSDEDCRRASIIEQLMCNYRADIGSVDARLDSLQEDGLIRRSGSVIEVTDEARPLVRVVAAAFDAYLASSGAVHAVAV